MIRHAQKIEPKPLPRWWYACLALAAFLVAALAGFLILVGPETFGHMLAGS